MKIKTHELTGRALDYAVALCEEKSGTVPPTYWSHHGARISNFFHPSDQWSDGGPIIERERISIGPIYNGYEVAHWTAVQDFGESRKDGPTPLIAAMRCYVASRLGDTVEIPKELRA